MYIRCRFLPADRSLLMLQKYRQVHLQLHYRQDNILSKDLRTGIPAQGESRGGSIQQIQARDMHPTYWPSAHTRRHKAAS